MKSAERVSDHRQPDRRQPTWLERARSLRKLIGAEAETTDRDSTLSPVVVEALKEQDLFWLLAPVELGGGDAHLCDAMEVIEELSFADGSSGWSFMANLGITTLASVYLGDPAVEAMFCSGGRAIAAGMLGPVGQARSIDGGYIVSGRFSFGSGIAHANWVGAGMVLMDGDEPVVRDGQPDVRVIYLPRDKVDVIPDWRVSGLIGTGSFDYVVPEQFVAADFTFDRFTLRALRGDRRFDLGLMSAGSGWHAAVALGLMKRTLAEIAEIASTKRRGGYPGPLAENDLFKMEFGIADAKYMGVRSYVLSVFDEADRTASAGGEVTPEIRARLRQATTWAHRAGAEVVQFAHLWGGSESIRWDSGLGRASRDMAVATQHAFVDPMTIMAGAPALLERWREVRNA